MRVGAGRGSSRAVKQRIRQGTYIKDVCRGRVLVNLGGSSQYPKPYPILREEIGQGMVDCA